MTEWAAGVPPGARIGAVDAGAVPLERWERVRDGVRARVARFVAGHPGRVTVLRRVRVWGVWASLLLLVVLLACLLVDAWRLHSGGSLTDLPEPRPDPLVGYPGAGPAAAGWWMRPRVVVDRHLVGRFAEVGGSARILVTALVALGVHIARDLVVILLAHARRDAGQPRRAAMTAGRAAAVMLREVRAEAIGAHAARVTVMPGRGGQPGRLVRRGGLDEVALEVGRRRRFRLIALVVFAVTVAAGTVLAVVVAQWIGTDLTPPAAAGDALHWLAGQFDSLADWWAARSTGQKILIGLGVAALFALSGGSLAFAFGASGVLTYGLEHGHGAADFMRDPGAATRKYLDTVTPAQFALDAVEFGLTFAPGNFAGAAAGRGARALAREYADDPVAFMARRRALLGNDRGAVDPAAFTSGRKLTWGTPQERADWVNETLNNPATSRRAAYGTPEDIAYQVSQAGPREAKLVTSDGSRIWADGVTIDPDTVVAIEAKFVRNPGGSSIYEGTAPDFVSRDALNQFDLKIERYGAVMADSGNPVGRLRLVASTPQAASFLGARARSILGPNADLVVIVAPPP